MSRNYRIGLLFVVCQLLLSTGVLSQTIKNGSQWWDGIRLYTATVDAAGNALMEGLSLEMGGDSFFQDEVGAAVAVEVADFDEVVGLVGIVQREMIISGAVIRKGG